MNEPIFFHGKKVGEIRNGVYVSYRSKSTFFKMHNGFGLSQDIIDELKDKRIRHILLVYDTELYYSSLENFTNLGIIYKDYSTGTEDKQIILALKNWTLYKNN